MSTLPDDTHKDLKLTYETIVALIPPPFHEQASSKVLFTCRQCSKQSQHEVATFVLSSSLSVLAQSHEYFEAAFPWSENLICTSESTNQDVCHNCACDYDWHLISVATCRLVWLQLLRTEQPLTSRYQ